MSTIKLSDLTIRTDAIIGVLEPRLSERTAAEMEYRGVSDVSQCDAEEIFYELALYITGSSAPIIISYAETDEQVRQDYKKVLAAISDKPVGGLMAR